jgi:hypothetical protein
MTRTQRENTTKIYPVAVIRKLIHNLKEEEKTQTKPSKINIYNEFKIFIAYRK